MFLPIWLIVLLFLGIFVTGLLVGWNNPKKQMKSLLDAEIDAAKKSANLTLQNALTTIKAKL